MQHIGEIHKKKRERGGGKREWVGNSLRGGGGRGGGRGTGRREGGGDSVDGS